MTQANYSMKLNPLQIMSNYPQVTNLEELGPGDVLTTYVRKENGYEPHNLSIIQNDSNVETVYTLDTKWGLSRVEYRQIVTKQTPAQFNFKPKDNAISSHEFIATDMEEYAQSQETITRWCAEYSKKHKCTVEKAWDLARRGMYNEINSKDEKGSLIKGAKKIISAMEDENRTVTLNTGGKVTFKVK